MSLKITSGLIAAMVVAAAAETGADPVAVMNPGARGVRHRDVTVTRRAVLLALPDPDAAAALGAKLGWWSTKRSARATLYQYAGECNTPAARAAADALAELAGPDPDPGDGPGEAGAAPVPAPAPEADPSPSPFQLKPAPVAPAPRPASPPVSSPVSSTASGPAARTSAALRRTRRTAPGSYAVHPADKASFERARAEIAELARRKPHLKPAALAVIVGQDTGLIADSGLVSAALSQASGGERRSLPGAA